MSFKTLSMLIKKSLIEIQLPSNREKEITQFLKKSLTLQQAGFSGQAEEMESNANEIRSSQSITNQLKHWRDGGLSYNTDKGYRKLDMETSYQYSVVDPFNSY